MNNHQRPINTKFEFSHYIFIFVTRGREKWMLRTKQEKIRRQCPWRISRLCVRACNLQKFKCILEYDKLKTSAFIIPLVEYIPLSVNYS